MSDRDLPEFDCYRVLGVPAWATLVEIEAAFRAAAMREHPDVSPDPAAATVRMQRLNVARDWLTDPARRQRYDAARGVHPKDSGRMEMPEIDGLEAWPTTYEPPERRGSQAGSIMASIALMVLISMIFIGSGSVVAAAIAVAAIIVLIVGVLLTILGAAR